MFGTPLEIGRSSDGEEEGALTNTPHDAGALSIQSTWSHDALREEETLAVILLY